jgi:hypothetical protein
LGLARLNTANCCRNARFSAAKAARLRKSARISHPVTFSMFLLLMLGRMS